jgi:hypothetical protein
VRRGVLEQQHKQQESIEPVVLVVVFHSWANNIHI